MKLKFTKKEVSTTVTIWIPDLSCVPMVKMGPFQMGSQSRSNFWMASDTVVWYSSNHFKLWPKCANVHSEDQNLDSQIPETFKIRTFWFQMVLKIWNYSGDPNNRTIWLMNYEGLLFKPFNDLTVKNSNTELVSYSYPHCICKSP